MAIFPSKFIRNPIPFALSLSSQAPITLPLLSRAQVPGPSVVLQKTKATLREEHLAHNPVKLLADARAQAEERALFKGKGSSFPRNLKIESLVDEEAEFSRKVGRLARGQLAKALARRS